MNPFSYLYPGKGEENKVLNSSHFKRSRNRPEGVVDTGPAPHVPEHLLATCPGCKGMLIDEELAENAWVCPSCGYHMQLPARRRIALVCDADSFEEWDEGLASCDPLEFPGYAAKLKNGRLATGEREAVVCGRGLVSGRAAAVFAMEPGFMVGSMGSVVGEKITRLFERAAKERLPVIGFATSGGARMQEGMLSLMQMAKTSGAVGRHSAAGLLYVAVLCHPTTGGVTASFAMEGDILLSEPGALIAFAGPRVIEQTIRQKLPRNFQRAEHLVEHGFLDAVIERPKLKKVLTLLLRLHEGQTPGTKTGEGE